MNKNKISKLQTENKGKIMKNFNSFAQPQVLQTPWFITGFADAEATFVVSIVRDNEYKAGWRVGVIFAIGLNVKDTILLEHIKSYFKVGTIRYSKADNAAIYAVQSLKDISSVIIPHFDKYPLLTQKRASPSSLSLSRERERGGGRALQILSYLNLL